ncbi:MAG TPA: PEP-CTERM sorting domain-containing protein [Gemmataceae bacterium]|jgi:sugar lactone lactonase YvrE
MSWPRFLIASAVLVLTFAPAQAQPVFVTDFYNNSILRVDSTTGATVPPAVGSVSLPAAFAYGPDGFLYSASQGTASIAKINPSTGAVVGSVTFGGQIQVPGGVAFAANGDMLVSDFVSQSTPGTGTVKRFTVNPSTGAATLVTTLASGLNQPSGLLVNGNNLYFTETNTSTFSGGRLSVVNLTGGAATPLVTGTPGTGFAGLALSGNTLYYADLLGGAIDRYDVGTNTALAALVAPGGSLANQFPGGLYIDSPASILVADLGSHQFSGAPPDPGNGNLRRYSTVTGLQVGSDIVSNIYGGAVINVVPEPGTLLLVGGAAAAFAAWRRKRA